jgi:hypothetical protein
MRDFAGETDPILHLPGDYPRGDYTFSGNISSDYLISSELVIDLTITTLPGSVPEIAVPTQVNVTDVTPDQGGWLLLSYNPSVNDIYHNNTRAPYVNGYILQQGIETERQTVWNDLFNFAPSADYEEILVEVPASDQLYQYRLAAYMDDNYSTWADAGAAAAADNMGIYANITVILEGAYSSALGNMQSNLDLPLTSPYNGEVINEIPPGEIIDWIQIILHASSATAAQQSCNGFLLADGTVVNTAGGSELPLYYTTGNPYYLVINHRNHIPVMSADTYLLADEQFSAGNIDFTDENAVIGDGIKDMGDFNALYAGDVDGDGFIGATDMNTWAVNYTSNDYIGSDIDLDGLVGATDANIWAVNWSKVSTIPYYNERDGQSAGLISSKKLTTANYIHYYLTEPQLVEYENSEIYYECDIIVFGDQNSRFLTGQLFIGYNTEVFGTSAAENYNLWVSAGELIDTQLEQTGPAPAINTYSVMSADYDKDTFTVGSVWNLQAVNDLNYENASLLETEHVYLHIALKVENPQTEHENLIWLEHNSLLDNQQTFIDHNNNWHSYSGIEYGAPQIFTGHTPENCMSGVYPNPFNPSTTIHFYLDAESEVELNIYNIKGQKVNTITAGSLPSGAHSITWNGTNPNNRTCASGVYFFQLKAGAKTETYRALLLK